MAVEWGSLARLSIDDIAPAAADCHVNSIIEGLHVNPNIRCCRVMQAWLWDGDPWGV